MSVLAQNMELIYELIAVISGLTYVILIARNKPIGWLFGIISALFSIFLFIGFAKLYSEAILYTYYVIAGFYGWYHWKSLNNQKKLVHVGWTKHVLIIFACSGMSYMLFLLMAYFFPDGKRPLIDAFTTVFSFLATYMATRKWISNWIYWIVIDLVSVWLYWSRDLEIYALLMLIYALMAVYGYYSWRAQEKIYNE